MNRRDLVAFTVSGRRLALPLADVGRAIAVPRLQAPVGTPAFLEGFFALGDMDVAVLRADRLLDLGDEPLGVYSPLLLLTGETRIALHVASIEGIVRAADVRPLGKDETFNSCVVGRFDYRDRAAYLLSAKAILLAEERARIAFHVALRESRLTALSGDGGNAYAA